MELPASFEALMNRSPISQADITSFLRDMRRTPSGTLVTSKLLAAKIQSASEAQAIHAFDILEAALESETEGSIEFRTEVGRYRFLNEIIRILSPKYLGDKTSPPVKERAVGFLEDAAGSKRKRWFPSEHSKIQAVYESLVDGGVIQRNPKFPSTEADEEAELQKSIFDRTENAAILKKLLQSKDPSDLQAANRLIKNLVDEETRRIERRSELHSLIDRIETSTSLMVEMLSQSNIDKEIVDELADTCRSLRQKLGGVATETNDETTSLLQASENLEKALELYDKRKDFKGDEEIDELYGANGKTASSSMNGIENPPRVFSLVDELLIGLDIDVSEDAKAVNLNKGEKSLKRITEDIGDNLMNMHVELSLKSPLGLSSPTDVAPNQKIGDGMDEIGRLSRELMDQSLMGGLSSVISPEFKKTDKTPLSQIRIPSMDSITLPQAVVVPSELISMLDLELLENPNGTSTKSYTVDHPYKKDENILLDLGNDNNATQSRLDSSSNKSNQRPSNSVSISGTSQMTLCPISEEVKRLLSSTKEIDLDKVDLIENLSPVELQIGDDSKDINLTLTFATCPDFPSPVKVAVVTLTNRSSTAALLNYVFQLMPPKGLQVKLLPPATMELPPWKKSFLPPPVLTQVALLVIPKGLHSDISAVRPKMRFILSYTSNEETALQNGEFEIPSSLYH